VIKQRPDRLPVRLTAAVVRGTTDLRVWIDDDTSCICIEISGTPCPVLLGVTVAGAENLRTAIATGLADLVSCRQKITGEQTPLNVDG
jgi:hypothetical protein